MFETLKRGVVSFYSGLSESKDRMVYESWIRKRIKDIPPLKNDQIKEIRDFFRTNLGIDVQTNWHRLYYAMTGIEDPAFIPPPVYEYNIRPCLNHPNFAIVWQNKVYLERLLPDIKTVRSVVRNTNGRFLNEGFNIISSKEAEIIMNGYEKLVVKPGLYSHKGMGIKLFRAPFDIREIDNEYGMNYVVQIPLRQHKKMAELNPSSINTFRVVSVLLGNTPHVCSIYAKVGAKGEFADNSGEDRFFLGTDPSGKFRDYAVSRDLKRIKSLPSGIDFAGMDVPGYRLMTECAKKAHKDMAFFGLAAFDICIDEDEEPVIVEANLKQPGILGQFASGPYFGKYTVDVLKYCKRRNITKEVGWPQMW